MTMTIEAVLYIVALAMIAALSVAALWHPKFRDNALQTIGLASMCFGAVVRIYTCLQGQDLLALRYALTYGLAVYGLGTAVKFWKFNRVDKAVRPLRRRVTDLQGDQP